MVAKWQRQRLIDEFGFLGYFGKKRKGAETTQVEIWSRKPGFTSMTFSHVAKGLLPITNKAPFKKEYDEELFGLAVSSEKIRTLLKLLHEAGAEYFELFRETIHASICLSIADVRNLIRKVFPEDEYTIYWTKARPHRKYKVGITRVSPRRLLIIFSRAKLFGFCPLSYFPSTVLWSGPIGLDEHSLVVSEKGKQYMKLLFKKGAEIGLAQTLMWVYGNIPAELARDLLYEVVPQEWLDVQIA